MWRCVQLLGEYLMFGEKLSLYMIIDYFIEQLFN